MEAIPRTLLRDRAYAALRDAIVAGELEPGAVVRDADLAERLGLSRAPVREAFSRLVDEGLLESKPQSYTRVTPVVAADVRDAAAVVGAMHELVTRIAVPRLFAADIETMRTANGRFAAAVAAGDVDGALQADDELHDVLVRVSATAPPPRPPPATPPSSADWNAAASERAAPAARPDCTSGSSRPARPATWTRRCGSPRRSGAGWPSSRTATDQATDPGRLPMSLSSYERYPLLFGPSPVHPLERLTAHLGGASLWAKREDCNSGVAYGGNKTRKLEYLVADALAQGCDTLVSIGGVQSNHTRQVAAVAARAGLKCVLVQESWVDWPDAVYDKVGNILISRLAGADVRLVRAGFGIGFKESWEQALREVEESGGKPYAIPAGASDHPLGGLGFAGWAYEVAEQERESGVFFDTVVVCSVTGSTQAGMVAGFAALEEAGGRPRRVLGIDASAKPAATREQIARIAHATGQLIGVKRELTVDDVELDERYHAGVYGIPDDTTLAAMRLAARTEGMVTDPVYEGKSMAGMIDLVERGEIGPDATVLYAHLGGQPALNAYSALF